MRSADSAGIEFFPSPGAMPLDAAALFSHADNLFGRRYWWDTVLASAMPAGTQAVFAVCRLGTRPLALFPMRRTASGALESLTTPYSCLYTPLLLPGMTADESRAVFGAFGRFCRSSAMTRLDAIPDGWPGLEALTAGAGAAGLAVRPFQHFGNWHEDISGHDWASYLAGRPGAARETVRRRLRRAERQADARFVIHRDAADIEIGIAAFESVYARSWKEPEPFPDFNADLIRATARAGIARLAIWSIDGQPVAAQFWIVEDGRATVLKLAHDEAFKPHSPGTVLTALMIRHLLDQEHVTLLDFGRGDDPYKQGWAASRRQCIGLMLFNPLRPSGLLGLARHTIGRLRASLRH
jgi:CelD/BcsL family acetyltransferase involved in cellulose biosynthesis